MSVTLSSIAVSSCSYLSTMLERMLLCNTARRWTTSVLAGFFLPKTGIDCRRHQVHLGRVDCHKPAPALKDVYFYSLCGKRAGVTVLHVKEQRKSIWVSRTCTCAFLDFCWHIPPAPCCLGGTPAGRLRALEASGLLGLSRHCSPAGCRPWSLPA